MDEQLCIWKASQPDPSTGRFHSPDWLIDPSALLLRIAGRDIPDAKRRALKSTTRRPPGQRDHCTQNGEALAVRTTGSTDTARLSWTIPGCTPQPRKRPVRLHPHALPLAWELRMSTATRWLSVNGWAGSTTSSTAAWRSPTRPCGALSPRRRRGGVRPCCIRTCSPRPCLWSARCLPRHGRSAPRHLRRLHRHWGRTGPYCRVKNSSEGNCNACRGHTNSTDVGVDAVHTPLWQDKRYSNLPLTARKYPSKSRSAPTSARSCRTRNPER